MIKRILLVNDDGIDAPGLAVAENIARTLTDDVWVVAPDRERSGSGCSLSFSDPIRLEQKGAQRFALYGTPVDCVMIALHHLLKDQKPDLILSGVNRGQNVAEDLIYSGTVAGAMQGLLSGIPSIALSQSFGMSGAEDILWPTSERYAPQLIERLFTQSLSADTAFNVNFPDRPPDEVEGVAITWQGRRNFPLLKMEERHDPRRRPYYWVDFNRTLFVPKEGSDIHAIYSGKISVTPLKLSYTDEAAYQHLQQNQFAADFDSVFERDIVFEK